MFWKIILGILKIIKGKIIRLEEFITRKKFTDMYMYNYATNEKILRDKNQFPLAKNIFEYSIKNNIKIENCFRNLDRESQLIGKLILKRVSYIYTHNLLDKSKLINRREYIENNKIKDYLFYIKKMIKLPISLYEPSIFYYKCGLHFIPQRIISTLKNKDIIDGGAYIGDSSAMFEYFFHPNRIYAFEPLIKNYNYLLKTINLNHLKKVKPLNLALGDKQKKIKVKSKGIQTYISENGDQEVTMITIDDFVCNNKLSIGLIKLDVEGFELNVINGAINTIKKFKPILSISIYHNGEEFFEMYKKINSICPNYKIIIRKLDPAQPFVETTLIGWVKD